MKYGIITEDVSGEKIYAESEDNIIDEAYKRLDDKQKKKFDAYEEGYGMYFEDFEKWFERFAPQIWSDVLNEVEEEKYEAEEELRERYEAEEREREIYGSYDEQVRREYYRDRI